MSVTCGTCHRHCVLEEGQVGQCRARVAHGGRVVSSSYGKVCSVALDPIEKKPLARYRPGSKVLSLGSFGCNLRCPWCQNHTISQAGEHDASWRILMPEAVRDLACGFRERDRSVVGVAYTYNEPLVGHEYVLDCARLVREAGLANVLVSAGCVSRHVARAVAPLTDAANIDLKGGTQAVYDRLGGDLALTVSTIDELVSAGAHVELTTLVVPGVNDTAEEMERVCDIVCALDPGICLHVTRFFGAHLLAGSPPTPVELVFALADVARQRLAHVRVGNVW